MAEDHAESAVAEKRSSSRQIDWGAIIIVTIAILVVLFGAWRFFLREHFGLIDALHCLLWLIPAALLALLFDYTLHHARLAAIMPLLVAAVLVITSPAFDIALGLVLIGTILMPAISEWRERKQSPATEPVATAPPDK